MIDFENLKKHIFWKLTKGYRPWIVISVFMVILETVSNVILPLLIGFMVDKGLQVKVVDSLGTISYTTNLDQVIFYGSLLIVFAITGLVLGVIGGIASAKASAGIGKNIRSAVYFKASKFAFENIDKYSVATLINRMGNDVANIVNAFNQMVRLPIRATFMFILALVFSISLSPQLSLMFLVILPLLVIFFALIWWKTYPIFKKTFVIYDDFNQKVQENLQGMRTIKSYVTEKSEANIIAEKIQKLTKINIYAEHGIILGGPAFSIVIFSAILFLGGYGTHLILDGTVTTGAILSFSSYVWQTSIAVTMFVGVIGSTVIAGPSAKRIFEIIKETPAIDENSSGITEVENGSITFKNVSLKYPSNKGNSLNNLTFNVPAGSTLGVVGRTGSGKSSLVALIARLYDVTEGEVLVAGVNVKKYNLHSLRDAVAVVLQKNNLFSGTIRENMQWGNEHASDEQIYQALANAGILEFVLSLEKKLDTQVEQGGTNFSGGQKQRLCIARALLKNPKILVLDDSTSAVDTKTEKIIQNALNTQIQECTKVIIAQRISSVINADHIIVVDQGEIVAQGTHEQLIENNEFYNSIYQAQLNAGGINEN
ncbi:ABC transporter ATP-binding protein [Mycoplasmopsis columboralis]|uniref:ABC-type multidrug/protein/lipid transport system ATPase component n=1 Tax=Mycoplasmopsis columboralis TaxID=171282 RepID=A0A449B7L4_9BACT|nr:ABC transporter ATP-binding protein [Mycoplasmopsis columboralis]VEU76575.1 ABC-type multidrug/protein/lipid transport system ATPase component [Mycoplasmopsis columboralis]